MSNTYLEALASERSHNGFLRKVVAGSLIAGVLGTYIAYTVPKTIEVHLAPDIRAGSVVEIKNGVGYIPPENVYSFAYYIWQQLNRWQEDGMKDYPKQLYNLQSFVTAKCQAEIKDDMKNRAKNSELLQRTRLITEIPGFSFAANRVITEGSAAWTVFLDMQLQETYRGQNVKDTFIRYPLRIVHFDVDRERNPWGLGLIVSVINHNGLTLHRSKTGRFRHYRVAPLQLRCPQWCPPLQCPLQLRLLWSHQINLLNKCFAV